MIDLIITGVCTSGATVAVINGWAKIRLKRMDISVNERQQFIKEVNDLRELMNKLYTQHYKIMSENAELRMKVQELEDHVNKKSKILLNLKSIIESYSAENPVAFFDRVKNLVSHYELPGR